MSEEYRVIQAAYKETDRGNEVFGDSLIISRTPSYRGAHMSTLQYDGDYRHHLHWVEVLVNGKWYDVDNDGNPSSLAYDQECEEA